MKTRSWLFSSVFIVALILACNMGSRPGAGQSSPQSSTQIIPSIPPTQAPPAGPALKPGDYKQNISVDGTIRSYLLHIPTGYDGSKALPLVFVLHGFGGTAGSMVKLTGLSEKADQEGFFVAYLNGTEVTDSAAGVTGQGWNNGLTPKLDFKVDDVAFVRDLADQLKGQLYVDGARIFAAGFSNGAFMTHRLGAELPDLLAGIAVVEGTIGLAQDDGTFLTIPNPAGPISVIMIHGKQDTNVLYDGGQATKGAGKLFAKSVADAVAFWTQADGCTGDPQSETSADGNVIKSDYQTCTTGKEVLLYSIVSGGHEWPRLDNNGKFSATDAIWDFFSGHSQ